MLSTINIILEYPLPIKYLLLLLVAIGCLLIFGFIMLCGGVANSLETLKKIIICLQQAPLSPRPAALALPLAPAVLALPLAQVESKK